jgi:hypothetical protein
MFGMVPNGMMWEISLDHREQLAPRAHKAAQVPRVLLDHKAGKVIQAQQVILDLRVQLDHREPLAPLAVQAHKDHKVILDHKVSKA